MGWAFSREWYDVFWGINFVGLEIMLRGRLYFWCDLEIMIGTFFLDRMDIVPASIRVLPEVVWN